LVNFSFKRNTQDISYMFLTVDQIAFAWSCRCLNPTEEDTQSFARTFDVFVSLCGEFLLQNADTWNRERGHFYENVSGIRNIVTFAVRGTFPSNPSLHGENVKNIIRIVIFQSFVMYTDDENVLLFAVQPFEKRIVFQITVV